MPKLQSVSPFAHSRAWLGGQLLVVLLVAAVALGSAYLVGLNLFIAGVLVASVVVAAAILQGLRHSRGSRGAKPMASFLGHVAISAVAVLTMIQFIPYGREHSNPPIRSEPQWATAETRELMVRSCFGCHSNEVDWPWYSNIAPMSWAITDHVDRGRDAVNYSDFGRAEEADETIEVILDGEMPPAYYTRFGVHSEANLTSQELSVLLAGLEATPGMGEEGESDDADDD